MSTDADHDTMRVLMLCYEFPPLGGGYGQYHLLAKELVNRGHEVVFLTSRLEGQPERSTEDGISVVRVKSFRQNRENATVFEMAAFLIFASLKLPEIVREFAPDVCHTFFGLPTGVLIFHPSIMRTPTVLTCLGSDVPHHNPDKFSTLYSVLTPLVKRIWSSYDAVVANSEELRREMLEISPSQDVEVVPNGIDTDQFRHDVEDTGDGFRLLYVGRLIPLKRVDEAIKLLAELNDESENTFQLDIVGEGKEREDLGDLAGELGVEHLVTFHGYIPHEEIDERYTRADFYIHLSETEGMSNTIMEAMACGNIPIVTEVGGVAELLDSTTGVVTSGKDDHEIVDRLLDLADSPEEMEAQKNRARERIVDEFSSRALAENYERIYGRYRKRHPL